MSNKFWFYLEKSKFWTQRIRCPGSRWPIIAARDIVDLLLLLLGQCSWQRNSTHLCSFLETFGRRTGSWVHFYSKDSFFRRRQFIYSQCKLVRRILNSILENKSCKWGENKCRPEANGWVQNNEEGRNRDFLFKNVNEANLRGERLRTGGQQKC